jgi:small subunit ribosomal protein S20
LANHKSAEKRVRQSEKRYQRNLATKRSVRTRERKLRLAITSGKKDEAQTLLREFQSALGKAAQKGLYKIGTLSRKVSRLSAQVDRLK